MNLRKHQNRHFLHLRPRLYFREGILGSLESHDSRLNLPTSLSNLPPIFVTSEPYSRHNQKREWTLEFRGVDGLANEGNLNQTFLKFDINLILAPRHIIMLPFYTISCTILYNPDLFTLQQLYQMLLKGNRSGNYQPAQLPNYRVVYRPRGFIGIASQKLIITCTLAIRSYGSALPGSVVGETSERITSMSRHQDSSEPRYQKHAKMQTDLQYPANQSCLRRLLKW